MSYNFLSVIINKMKFFWEIYLKKRTYRLLYNDLNHINYSIISQNCIGGRLYKILHQPYSSPTIGLWFESHDFLKFCDNLYYYLQQPLNLDESSSLQYGYPVCNINDIKIYFQHYSSFDEVKEKWYRRIKRLDNKNIFIILTDRDGFSNSDLEKFFSLETNNKVLLTNKKINNQKNVIYIPGYEHQNCVGDLYTDYQNLSYFTVRKKLRSLMNPK